MIKAIIINGNGKKQNSNKLELNFKSNIHKYAANKTCIIIAAVSAQRANIHTNTDMFNDLIAVNNIGLLISVRLS